MALGSGAVCQGELFVLEISVRVMSRAVTQAFGFFPSALLSPREAYVINGGSVFRLKVTAEGGAFRLLSLARNGDFQDGAAPMGLGGAKIIEIAGGPDVFMKLVELPPMPRREAVETLRHTQADSAPFPLRDAFMDVWITGRTQRGRMTALMAAMSGEKAKERWRTADGRRPRPNALTNSVAAVRALVRHGRRLDKTGPLLFAVIEGAYTGLYIFRDGEPVFIREAPFSLPDSSGDENGAAMKRLAVEIERTLDYFRRSGPEEVREAYLVGRGAMTGGLARYLSDFTGTPFRVFDPFEDFVATDGAPSVPGPEAAVAVGAVIDGGETINLIAATPWRRGLGALNRWPYWLAAAAVGLFIFFARQGLERAVSGMEVKTASLRAEAEAAGQRLAERRSLAESLRGLRENIERFRAELAGYPVLRGSGMDWGAFFNGVAEAMPESLALTRLSLDMRDEGSMELEGLARGSGGERIRALAELSENLEALPSVGSVLSRRMERRAAGETPVFRMTVALALSRGDGTGAAAVGAR